MLGVSCCAFLGIPYSFRGIFSANSNPLFISVIGYPLGLRVVCSSLRRVFLRFLSVIIVTFLRDSVKDEFYTVFEVVVFEVEVLLGVSGFVVDISDDLVI